jgi:hypothetical protein
LNLEITRFRVAADKDKLDGTIAKAALIQPDWLEETVVPEHVPPGIPSQIPNPAYISS